MPNHPDQWYEDRGLSLELPGYMRDALQRGLDLHAEGKTGDGLDPDTVEWARKGVEDGRWPAWKWAKADAWFARHNHDYSPPAEGKSAFNAEDPGPGESSWFLWGDKGDGQGPVEARDVETGTGRRKCYDVHERIKELDDEAEADRDTQSRAAASSPRTEVTARRSARMFMHPRLASRLSGRVLAAPPDVIESVINSGAGLMGEDAASALERVRAQMRPLHLEVETGLRYRAASVIEADDDEGMAGEELELEPLQEKPARYIAYFFIRGSLISGSARDAICFDGTGYADIEAVIDRYDADRENCLALYLVFSTGGGEVEGCQPCAARIRRAVDNGLNVIGIAADNAFSAGCWLLSACNERYITPTGGTGSIGVVFCHFEQSAWDAKEGLKVTYITSGEKKAELNPHQPLSEPARATAQRMVDLCAEQFFADVSRYTGLEVETIRGFKAGVFFGPDAVATGLVHGIKHLHELEAALMESARASLNPAPAGGTEASMRLSSTTASEPAGTLQGEQTTGQDTEQMGTEQVDQPKPSFKAGDKRMVKAGYSAMYDGKPAVIRGEPRMAYVYEMLPEGMDEPTPDMPMGQFAEFELDDVPAAAQPDPAMAAQVERERQARIAAEKRVAELEARMKAAEEAQRRAEADAKARAEESALEAALLEAGASGDLTDYKAAVKAGRKAGQTWAQAVADHKQARPTWYGVTAPVTQDTGADQTWEPLQQAVNTHGADASDWW